MNRFILSIVCVLLFSQGALAQKYATKSGEVTFEASVASFEEVKATHNNVSAILNTLTGEFASLALINGFKFKVALMEEHFNENYMESSRFPKALVKGKIEGFDTSLLTEEFQEFMLKGTIEMRGKTKALYIPIRIKTQKDSYLIETNFELKPEDFDIEIPSIVANKVAKTVVVNAVYSLNPL